MIIKERYQPQLAIWAIIVGRLAQRAECAATDIVGRLAHQFTILCIIIQVIHIYKIIIDIFDSIQYAIFYYIFKELNNIIHSNSQINII